MTKEEHIEYWVKTAEHDLLTAQSLFDTGHYDWCLFIGHLILEKILKAHFVNDNDDIPPKIHDLVRLAEKTKLNLTDEQLTFFEKANYFVIASRYPDEKLKFYKICTQNYAENNFTTIKELYLWLKTKLK